MLTTDTVARKFHAVLPGLPRLDALKQLAFLTVGNALGAEDGLDAGQLEAMEVVACFVRAAATEPADVVDQHGVEVAPVLGVGDHLLELVAAPGARPADGVVHVPADDAVAMLPGPLLDVGLLVRDGPLL